MSYLVSKDGQLLSYKNKFFTIKDLNATSWADIKAKCDRNSVPKFWLGMTKEIEIDSQIYHVRLVDIKEGRYAKANGGYTHATFEFVETYPGTFANEEDTAYESTTLFSSLQNGVFDSLPSDLKAVIEPIKIKAMGNVYEASSQKPYDVQCKLFNVGIGEILNINALGSGNEFYWLGETSPFKNGDANADFNPSTSPSDKQWDYYKSSTSPSTNLLAIKNQNYWTRSWFFGKSYLNTSGTFASSGDAMPIAPCFSL